MCLKFLYLLFSPVTVLGYVTCRVNMVVVLPPLLNRFGPFLSEAVNCCNCRTIIGWYIVSLRLSILIKLWFKCFFFLKIKFSIIYLLFQLQVDPTYDWGHMMPGSYVFDLTMLHYVGPAVVIQDDPHPNQNNGQQQNDGPMQNGD